ncbi:MAG TPA: inositol monophosphatase [Thermopetrobacter sp.]|nr:inositol monophosphatase [Thermopetrobacter sp.]
MSASALINVMVRAARKAARPLRRDFGEVENLQVSKKGPADFVTRADRRTEEILRDELHRARPAYGFILEEGADEAGDGEHHWIIDPVDGTTNFIHGIPHFAMSIALRRGDHLEAALIYNPVNDELFHATRGGGAFLNNRRIRVSARNGLAEAVIVNGCPHRGRADLARFRRELAVVQREVSGLRRYGAASLDFAWLAAGRFDGYWERGLKVWDIAAGILMVREAGGRIEELDAKGDILRTGDILAAAPGVFEPLARILRAVT